MFFLSLYLLIQQRVSETDKLSAQLSGKLGLLHTLCAVDTLPLNEVLNVFK